MVIADTHQAFVYVIINGLRAEHLLSWEITFFHSLAYAGINGDTKLKEAVLNMGCTQTKPDASTDVENTLGSKLVNRFQEHAKEESADPIF